MNRRKSSNEYQEMPEKYFSLSSKIEDQVFLILNLMMQIFRFKLVLIRTTKIRSFHSKREISIRRINSRNKLYFCRFSLSFATF